MRRLARHLREARLPVGKTLERFEFDAVTGADRLQLSRLACESDWVEAAQNLLLFGPSGVGKSHLYEAASVLITANQPFSAWDRIFPDDMMAVAAIDRLIHHAHVVELSGEINPPPPSRPR